MTDEQIGDIMHFVPVFGDDKKLFVNNYGPRNFKNGERKLISCGKDLISDSNGLMTYETIQDMYD